MNLPPSDRRAAQLTPDVHPDHSITHRVDSAVRQVVAATTSPHSDPPSFLPQAIATETRRRLQLQALPVATSTIARVSAIAMPDDHAMMADSPGSAPAAPAVSAGHSPVAPLQGRPPRGEAPYFEPPWISRRLALRLAAAEPGNHSPGRDFRAELRDQGTPTNLQPRRNPDNMASTAGVSRQRSAPPSPAATQIHRRSRALAFDDSEFPPGLRPPRLIREHLQYAPTSLEHIVASWNTAHTVEALATLQSQWHDISAEDGAHTFGEFLVRLNENINAKNLAFRQQTSDLLDQIGNDPALRQQVFAISVEATTSCEDRVSHAMVMMQTAARAAHFKQTSFATDAQAVLVQRQFHRLDLLHDMARTIVDETGNGEEELETHLHLLIRHVDALELNGSVPAMEMYFDGCSDVSDERSATIPAEIKQLENEKFAEWLAHSPSWLDYIARTDKARFDYAQDARDTLFDTEFQQRLDARLGDTGLNKNLDPATWADAERVLGKAVSEQMINEINTGLTKDFLAARGNLQLLEKYWPDDECSVTTRAA